jgi:hypothetical protein
LKGLTLTKKLIVHLGSPLTNSLRARFSDLMADTSLGVFTLWDRENSAPSTERPNFCQMTEKCQVDGFIVSRHPLLYEVEFVSAVKQLRATSQTFHREMFPTSSEGLGDKAF